MLSFFCWSPDRRGSARESSKLRRRARSNTGRPQGRLNVNHGRTTGARRTTEVRPRSKHRMFERGCVQDALVNRRYASGRLSEIGKVSFVAAVGVC